MDARTSNLEYGLFSSPGQVREHNEDAVLAVPEHNLWVIADGMGGHAAGEVASEIVIGSIKEFFEKNSNLNDAIFSAQQRLKDAVENENFEEGMGTTVVAAHVNGNRYKISWVGDSRAYLWFDDQVRQLTHDHSYVQQLLDEGAISEKEADTHPEKCTLTRCLGGGIEDELVVDSISGTLFAKEKLILCTDGINSELDDSEIALCMKNTQNASAADSAKALVEAAVAAGGNDNASAIVIASAKDAPARIQQTAPRPIINTPPVRMSVQGRRFLPLFIVVAVALLIAAISAFFISGRSSGSPANTEFIYSGPNTGGLIQDDQALNINYGAEGINEVLMQNDNQEIWRADFEAGENDETTFP